MLVRRVEFLIVRGAGFFRKGWGLVSDDDDDGAPGDGPDESVADPGPGRRSGRDGEPEQGGGDGVVVHPGHVMGMSGVMDGVAGRYEAAVKFLQSHGRPDGNGWTGLMEELKGPLAGAVDAFARRLQKREADARDSKGKFQDAARQYAGADAANAGALRLDVGDGSSASGDGATDAGGDVEAEDYPSADDVDFAPPEEPDSQQQEDLKQIVEQLSHSGVDAAVKKLTGHGLVEEILKPFVAHWPELVKIGGAYGAFGQAEDQIMGVVDSGRQRLAENWQGPAHDAADAHLKDRVGGGDAPIGHAMAELLTAVHDGVEQTISGLVDYLKDGLNQQGTYKGQPVTVAQLAANHDKLPPDVAQELQDPLTTFAQQALEYVQTGRQIVDQAKVAIGQIEAGDADAAAVFVGQAGGRWHQAAADISGEDEAQTGDPDAGDGDKAHDGLPPFADGWSKRMMGLKDEAEEAFADKMAKAVQFAYDPDNPDVLRGTGFRPLTDKELAAIGVSQDELRNVNGLRAELLTDGQGHVVMSMAGNRGPEVTGEILTVMDEAQGGVPPELRSALDIGQKVANKYGASNLMVTGHSMGGGHATVVAQQLGTGAYTFQSEGAGPGTYTRLGMDPQAAWDQAAQGQVRQFAYTDDQVAGILTKLGFNVAYGQTTYLPQFDADDNPNWNGTTHDIGEVERSLGQMMDQGIGLPDAQVVPPSPLYNLWQQLSPISVPVLDGMLDMGLGNPPPPAPPPVSDDGGDDGDDDG